METIITLVDLPEEIVGYTELKNSSATFEHEATTSKISDDQMFYCQARGMNEEEAVALIVNGFVRDVIQQLPMEFMAETQKLIGAPELALMQESSVLINISRGSIVDWPEVRQRIVFCAMLYSK